MKIILIFLMTLSFSALAETKERPIDLSGCIEKDCFAKGVHEFKPEENIKIQAWFDIVHWGGERGIKFYPLFNVYNYTSSPSKIFIGMQLLDKNKKILVEAKFDKLFDPTQKTEPSYETYISINAKSVTKKFIRDTRFFKVIYKR